MKYGETFHFKSTKAFSTATDLVRVSVLSWDTDFTHMQVAHTEADTLAEATYSSTVLSN